MTDAERRAKTRIVQVCELLHIPQLASTTAQALFDRVRAELDPEGRRYDPLAAACLTVACKSESLPITVKDVTRAWGEVSDDEKGMFDAKTVNRRAEKVTEITNVTIPLTDPIGLVDRYATELSAPDSVTEDAKRILRKLMQDAPQVLTRGTSPSGNAAAALYLAAKTSVTQVRVTQSDIADVANVSELTIRNRYQEMQEVLGGEGGIRSVDPTDQNEDETNDNLDVSQGDGKNDETRDDGEGIEIGLNSYIVLQQVVRSKELNETELITTAVKDAIKRLLDGGELESVSYTDTVSVTVDFPDRIRRLVDAELSDPTLEIDTIEGFVTAAIMSSLEADGEEMENEIATISMPGHVFKSAQYLVSQSDEYASLDDLLRLIAIEEVRNE
ncbi:hypothetical protein HSB1_38630 [Halogranum salarium B-1]|uniref:Cyclin-like domain-containing protein n=1 Tax=Halogranum salarium B-1 TaxID=1210908 RepID=J2ZXN2_9EURY|nr:hypothetical protein HSB1_38630 [Halogranum salarium B-1]